MLDWLEIVYFLWRPASQDAAQELQEEEARKIADTNFIVSGMFKLFAVRDGNLITGQQQFSGGAAAEPVVQALGR